MATQKEMIQATHDTVIKLKAVLTGVNGDQGLVGEVKAVKTDVRTLNNHHRKLSRNFWLLVGILAGSGVLAGGLWGLLGSP